MTTISTIILRFGEIWLCPQFCSISVDYFENLEGLKLRKCCFSSFFLVFIAWILSWNFLVKFAEGLENLTFTYFLCCLCIMSFSSLLWRIFYPPCSPLYLSFWTGSPMHEAQTIVGFGEGRIYTVLPYVPENRLSLQLAPVTTSHKAASSPFSVFLMCVCVCIVRYRSYALYYCLACK